MYKAQLRSARKTIQEIALREGESVEQVRNEMKIAMEEGLKNNDPAIKSFWKSIPCVDTIPTPEEFIAFTSGIVKQRIK